MQNDLLEQPVRGTWRVYMCAALAAIVRVWLVPVFPMTGIGTFLFFCLVLASVWFAAPQAAGSHAAKFYLVLAAVQLIPILLYRSIVFSMLDMMAFFGMCLFAVAGNGNLLAAPLRVVKGLFRNIPVPFRDLNRLTHSREEDRLAVVLALIVSVPFLVLVLFLLGSADDVFGGLLSSLFGNAERIGDTIARVLLTLILFLPFASGLIALRLHKEQVKECNVQKMPGAGIAAVLVLFDIVYLVFAVVQIRYLFLGREAAAMQGGFAEYARKGFFQLTAIAAGNCAAVWIGVRCADRRGFCRAAGGVMTVLTAVILASAAYRMCLYISAFGMSILRLLTLYAMAVIACALVLTGRMLLCDLRCPVRTAAACAAVLYCVLSLCNPPALIANRNVAMWKSGSVQKLDSDYLAGLGPDAAGAIRAAAEADPANASRYASALAEAYDAESPQWYDRGLMGLLADDVCHVRVELCCDGMVRQVIFELLWNGENIQTGGAMPADGSYFTQGDAVFRSMPNDGKYALRIGVTAGKDHQENDTVLCEVVPSHGDAVVIVRGGIDGGYTAEIAYGAEKAGK